MARGWYNLACWNGLGASQQARLIHRGNLPLGYQPHGTCKRGAEVCIETQNDVAPGPRFYCCVCAVDYLLSVYDDRIMEIVERTDD